MNPYLYHTCVGRGAGERVDQDGDVRPARGRAERVGRGQRGRPRREDRGAARQPAAAAHAEHADAARVDAEGGVVVPNVLDRAPGRNRSAQPGGSSG